jgi:hypothetical protein
MGKMARDKGARGEREIIDLLQPIVDAAYAEAGQVPPQLKRTSSMQADGGGCDIHGIAWLALEVKRCETLQVEQWWHQCVSQAKADQLPVLVYRQNGCKWRVRLTLVVAVLDGTVTADIAFDHFCNWLREALRRQLRFERVST